MSLSSASSASAVSVENSLTWKQLASIPDREGFAGSFAGVHNGALIVGGGANFPDKKPWDGGTKTWYKSVFVLEDPLGQWKSGFNLPRPLGYGVSVTHTSGIVCVGGSDANGHSKEVFLVKWVNGQIQTVTLKDLPEPCANMCGALVGDTLFVAGGLEKPDATNTLKTFWALNVTKPDTGWRELEPWPGPGRMLASAGTYNGSFYLFGGANLKSGSDNKPIREWLKDAYCYQPRKGWKRIADLPRPCVAAPSPAPVIGSSILLLGGDDGAQVNATPTEHRGFPREVLLYDVPADQWKKVSGLPFALVTTPCLEWEGNIIAAGGEARPGVRSTDVWSGSPVKRP